MRGVDEIEKKEKQTIFKKERKKQRKKESVWRMK